MSLPLLGLLAIIPAMLANFTTSLLGLPQPIYCFSTSFYSHGLFAKFYELSRPFYYVYISYYPFGLISHHSCHASPLGLLIYSLNFLDPFTFFFFLSFIIFMSLLLHSLDFFNSFIFSLSLVIFMGLLAINAATPTQWTCFPTVFDVLPLVLFHFSYCWFPSADRPFVKKALNQC